MKQYNPDIHHRRTIRLSGYDYAQNGLYFVTICVNNRKNTFGEIVDAKMRLNKPGLIAKNEWLSIPNHRQYVVLHDYVVMPNHIHGIIEIDQHYPGVACRGVARNAPTCNAPTIMSGISPQKGTLSVIIRAYKSAVTKNIHESTYEFSWQRNYYEHIIRNEQDYIRIAEYIANNQAQWAEDRFFTLMR